MLWFVVIPVGVDKALLWGRSNKKVECKVEFEYKMEFDFEFRYYANLTLSSDAMLIWLWVQMLCYRVSHVAQAVKNLPADAEDTGSVPGSGRSPGGGHGNPL